MSYARVRLACRLAALAPAFLIGLPLQGLLNRFQSPLARRLPLLFHRYVCRVLGLRRILVNGPLPQGPMLVVANHVSWLDIVVLGAVMPVAFVAKSEVAGWPFVRTLARLQRTVFVDRQNRRATGVVADSIARRLAEGEAVVLFAEGTTSDGNRVLPLRSALLAAAAPPERGQDAEGHAVVVQPVVLSYSHLAGLPVSRRERPAIAWYGDMDLAPHLAALIGGGPIDVRIGFCAPIRMASAGERKAVASAAEHEMRQLLRGPMAGRSPMADPEI